MNWHLYKPQIIFFIFNSLLFSSARQNIWQWNVFFSDIMNLNILGVVISEFSNFCDNCIVTHVIIVIIFKIAQGQSEYKETDKEDLQSQLLIF